MAGGETLRLMGNREFVEVLHQALRTAERRVLIQVMTFDGDASGLAVADLLIDAAHRGVEVRLLVDCFALRYVSDTPATDPSVRAEAAETEAMFERLRAAGVAVTFTQPFGPLLLFGLSRNHKKLYVVDDHAFLGGINISDHNFAWRDFMVRVEDPAAAETLAEDFACTQRGDRRSIKGAVVTNAGAVVTNTEIEPVFNDIINSAICSVVLASPYSLDIGVVRLFEQAQAPHKTVITAVRNNFKWLRASDPYLWNRLLRAGVKLRTYPDFFHTRFLLADDDKLLVGSSNFSRQSFRCNQEVCLLITDTGFIADFKQRMLTDAVLLPEARSTRQALVAAFVAHFYFYGIVGAGRLVAPFTPPLSRR